MLPKENLNYMKTFKDKNPAGSKLNKAVIDRFLNQQHEFLDFIDKSKKVSLMKTKLPLTISKLLKLSLGDTFRFSVAHNERHVLQAERAVK